jgi:salicylate hydroxylase
VLRVYARVRQPRAQRVWEYSKRAGEIYDGRAGYEGIKLEEMQSFWDYVWDRPLDADLNEAEDALVGSGAFSKSSSD